ncbi:MAG: hypothetical protein PUF72_00025 [Clostridiales bacterium]|nr:hypothetical protein [Clostridiales bacterium]
MVIKKRKRANMSIVLVVWLIAMTSGIAVLSYSISSKYKAKQFENRMENRYVSESGVDLILGLVEDCISQYNAMINYEKNDIGYEFINSPCIFDIDRTGGDVIWGDYGVRLDLIEQEAVDYLVGLGYQGYNEDNSIQIEVVTDDIKKLQISQLVNDAEFHQNNSGNATADMLPLDVHIYIKYGGGCIDCLSRWSDIKIIRGSFGSSDVGGVPVYADTSGMRIDILKYDNYGINVQLGDKEGDDVE